MNPDFEKEKMRGKVWFGIAVVGVGAAFFARALGVALPTWLFTWPMILILVGIITLGKHKFQKPGGLIPLTIGGVFLAQSIFPDMQYANLIWPALIVLFGLSLIMSPWKKAKAKKYDDWQSKPFETSTEDVTGDYLDIDAIFSGVERNIYSKNFKGGRVDCVFGGAEINMLQADIEGTVVLQVNAVFGGIELSVPASWKVQTEVSAVLGGVEDKRRMVEDTSASGKILVVKGSVVFGGVSIKGY